MFLPEIAVIGEGACIVERHPIK
jgi:hypothetical protein